MASPFPGMDPYFEDPGEWTSFHAHFIGEIAAQLAPKLRPRYLVRMERYFLTDDYDADDSLAVSNAERSSIYPDVGVYSHRRKRVTPPLVAIAPPPLRVKSAFPEDVPHMSLRVLDVKGRKLVAAIELLSPTNKRGVGRKQYLARRTRILNSSAHLMEIDLLHAGRRAPVAEPLPNAPYFVLLNRANHRRITEVWPVALDTPLPVVPVPLNAGDADVPLDLQAALMTMCDTFGFAEDVDYSKAPSAALSKGELKWVDARLRAVGVRKKR